MSSLKVGFASPATYNSLPHIRDVAGVLKVNSNDLDFLRAILGKHKVPDGVCIRLVHKHFDIVGDEVVVFQDTDLPDHGVVRLMRPIKLNGALQLRGINYFVDGDGQLQSYEYTTSEGPDMSGYTAFFDEFCRVVTQRGLQHKLGLKLGLGKEKTGWTEFEFPKKRATIMIPKRIPLPEVDYDIHVTTEWDATRSNDCECIHCGHNDCAHSDCNHCGHNDCYHSDCIHCSHGDDSNETELFLGGKKLEPGWPIHSLVLAARKEL